ncbi:DEAD/DEAH box helicase [Gracilibacillus kekensis]|uniref:Competence protein ComFA n=1 Tax=Gracilibacillus kekensis TaxID=1027249 RepID=A0A1M7N090_9BACI|nr:helicase-related protein [Gracilibacillus kekensis]SHM96903.1 competence protein ComFA [Gracilibacillus kekensis]
MNFTDVLAGKLLLPQEIPLSIPTIAYLQRTNQISQLPSIKQKYNRYQCLRCGNSKQSLFANLPCARCHNRHVYCRHCIATGRVLACENLTIWAGDPPTWPKQIKPCNWKGTLTKHQRQAAETLKNALESRQPEQLVWAVCGSGKTEMLFPVIEAAIKDNLRIGIATPRADVVRELFPRMHQAFPQTAIEALYADSPDRTGTGQLVISTTHQLIRYQEAFDLMIIDEIDAFPFHHDSTLPFLANRACKKVASKIYLTATPRPSQQKQITKKKLPTIFIPVRYHGHPLPIPQPQIEWNLKKKLERGNTPNALQQFMDNRPNIRQLLIFVPSIAILDKASTLLNAVSVHAGDPDRKEKVLDFRQKKLDILVTTTILERGVTFPSVDVVVLDAGHGVFDEAALVQIAGRAGRSPEDPTGEVVLIHQGKTNAIEQAIAQIKMMNRKGANL